jgi:predicted RNase H-like nuclease (RuvC/YqgF family)
MIGHGEDWRVEGHDREIKLLRERLYEAESKIRELERRPTELLLKAEMWFLWLLAGGMWIFSIVEVATKS